MKITLAEYNRFLNDYSWWDGSVYVDNDSYLERTGQPICSLQEEQVKVIPLDWRVVLVGRVHLKDDCKPGKHAIDFLGLSLAAFYRRWKKTQQEKILVVRIDKDLVGDLIRAVEALGGRVL